MQILTTVEDSASSDGWVDELEATGVTTAGGSRGVSGSRDSTPCIEWARLERGPGDGVHEAPELESVVSSGGLGRVR
jgi:hypothetical protein